MERLQSFPRWLVSGVGALTLAQFMLLWLTLVSVALGLAALVGHLPFGMMFAVAAFSLLLGWQLARTRLAGWSSGTIAVVVGLLGLLLTVGQIARPVWALQSTLWPLAAQVQRCAIWSPRHILTCDPPGLVSTLAAWESLLESLSALAARFAGWYQTVRSGIRVIDPMVTSLLWGTLFWWVGVWAAWWLRRRSNVGIGLLPAMVLLAYNAYYTNDAGGILWLVLAGGGWAVLYAVESYQKASQRWLERCMDRVNIEPLLAGTTALLIAGAMLAGGLLPSVSFEKISNAIQAAFHSQPDKALSESLGLQQTPGAAGKGYGVGLTNTHPIGAGPQLSQEKIMYVTVDGYQPLPPDAEPYLSDSSEEARYYWRSQTYDQYNGHTWFASASSSGEVPADALYYPSLTSLAAHERLIVQHVERLQPDEVLFVTGNLLKVNQTSFALWRSLDDLIGARIEADTYTAESRVQYVSVEQLRAAGDEYPQSIQRYLNLPEELPARVRDLALDLAARQSNPYDRAVAIQDYLRQFPYSLEVPAPPAAQDVADYFLFDLQEGYCDYYATSMAVMARAVGLPARLVIGYTSGVYDYDDQRFVVVEANSHAWVEIYFPDIGWVEFEPTASQPTFPRLGESGTWDVSNSLQTVMPGSTTPEPFFDWGTLQPFYRVFWGTLAGLAAFLLVFFLFPFQAWRLYFYSPDRALSMIYRDLYRRGRAWGIHPDATRTPHEFAALLVEGWANSVKRERFGRLTTSLRADLGGLTDLYTRLLFGAQSLTRDEQRYAVRAWQRLRRSLSRLRRSRICTIISSPYRFRSARND